METRTRPRPGRSRACTLRPDKQRHLSANTDMLTHPLVPVGRAGCGSSRRRGPARCVRLAALVAIACFWTWIAVPARCDEEKAAPPSAGTVRNVTAEMSVTGHLRFDASQDETERNEGEGEAAPEESKVPLSVEARFVYDEKSLPVVPGESDFRAVRSYQQAGAVLRIGDSEVQPRLRAERRLIVSEFQDGREVLFCPQGPLLPEELDLIEIPGSSAVLYALLPPGASDGFELEAGQSWKPDPQALAALVKLSHIESSSVACSVEGVTEDRANLTAKGKVTGRIDGATSTMTVAADFTLDRQTGQIDRLGLTIEESREASATAAAFDVTAQVEVTITPPSSPGESSELSEDRLAGLPLSADEADTRLRLRSPTRDYRCLVDRRWRLVRHEPRQTELRYLDDDGRVLAVCQLMPAPWARLGEARVLEEFQAYVERWLGDRIRSIDDASVAASRQGVDLLRIALRGEVDGQSARWFYYAAQQGETTVIAIFALSPEAADEFGDADRRLMRDLELVTAAPQQAER